MEDRIVAIEKQVKKYEKIHGDFDWEMMEDLLRINKIPFKFWNTNKFIKGKHLNSKTTKLVEGKRLRSKQDHQKRINRKIEEEIKASYYPGVRFLMFSIIENTPFLCYPQ